MKVVIRGVPEIEFLLEEKHIALLEKMAVSHYDARCRMFAADQFKGDSTSGTLKEWRNMLMLNAEYGCESMMTASPQQIDTAFKIMESFGLTDEEEKTRSEIMHHFTAIWKRLNKLYETWGIEFDTEEE